MNNTVHEQLLTAKIEIGKMAHEFTKGLSSQVCSDLAQVHKQIVDDFYVYNPSSYHRNGNLYESLIIQSPIKTSKGYQSGIVVGSFSMYDEYRISPDNVFDLFWNKGIRGLPKIGLRTLDDDGTTWENPYWDQDKYQNVFKTQIKLGQYTSVNGTPNQVIADITRHWGLANGEETCNLLYTQIKNKY